MVQRLPRPALVCPGAYPASGSRVYSHGDLVMIKKGHFFFPMSLVIFIIIRKALRIGSLKQLTFVDNLVTPSPEPRTCISLVFLYQTRGVLFHGNSSAVCRARNRHRTRDKTYGWICIQCGGPEALPSQEQEEMAWKSCGALLLDRLLVTLEHERIETPGLCFLTCFARQLAFFVQSRANGESCFARTNMLL